MSERQWRIVPDCAKKKKKKMQVLKERNKLLQEAELGPNDEIRSEFQEIYQDLHGSSAGIKDEKNKKKTIWTLINLFQHQP